MIANLKASQVKRMATHAVAVLLDYRKKQPASRIVQSVRCTDILTMCEVLAENTTVQLSLDDYKALHQLPPLED